MAQFYTVSKWNVVIDGFCGLPFTATDFSLTSATARLYSALPINPEAGQCFSVGATGNGTVLATEILTANSIVSIVGLDPRIDFAVDDNSILVTALITQRIIIHVVGTVVINGVEHPVNWYIHTPGSETPVPGPTPLPTTTPTATATPTPEPSWIPTSTPTPTITPTPAPTWTPPPCPLTLLITTVDTGSQRTYVGDFSGTPEGGWSFEGTNSLHIDSPINEWGTVGVGGTWEHFGDTLPLGTHTSTLWDGYNTSCVIVTVI